MLEALSYRPVTARRGLSHLAFIFGLGLSALAAIMLFGIAYFAGTAPRLPPSAAALENLQTDGGNWPPVHAQPLSGTAPDAIAASPEPRRL
jgi:hypothetical protein